jgi:hypothetical protein
MLVLCQVGFTDDRIRLRNIPPVKIAMITALNDVDQKKYRAEAAAATVSLCLEKF